MKIFCSEDIFWFQSYWNRDIPYGNFRLLFGNSMVVIQILFINLTPLCHICWKICSLTVTYDWFPVVLSKSWRVPHVGQEMFTLSGTPDFTLFDFTHSIYIYIVYYWICQFKDYAYWLMILGCLPGLVWLLCLRLILLSLESVWTFL